MTKRREQIMKERIEDILYIDEIITTLVFSLLKLLSTTGSLFLGVVDCTRDSESLV